MKKKFEKRNRDEETLLLALIADSLRTLVWFKTEDGQKKRNRPPSIYDAIIGKKEEKEAGKPMTFRTKEALDAALSRFEKRSS